MVAAVKVVVLVTLVLSLWPQGSRGNQEPQDVLECPVWFIPERDMCMCGDSINGQVHCSNESGHNASLAIAPYTCMTYDEELNTTIFGASFYCNTPYPSSNYYSLHVTRNTTAFNYDICAPLNRQGRLCEQCKDGYMPVHCAYPQYCVKNNLTYKVLFIMNILPTTIFFLAVLVLRIDVITPPASSFILFNQYLYYLFSIRYDPIVPKGPYSTIAKLINSFYGLLNLNYFNELLPYTCLYYSGSEIANLLLAYFRGIYPFLLVVVTYICIELHARNFWPLIILWRPFGKCFTKLRWKWDIKYSVLNALITFVMLSYCQLGVISSGILQPVQLFTPNGTALPTLYSYFAPSVKFLRKEHLPAAIVAIVFAIPLFAFPFFLLLYPFRCFQNLLERLRLNRHGLQAFMDKFQGHFKNGTGGTSDWRAFSAVYFFARGLFGVAFAVGLWLSVYIPLAVLVIIALAMPYKRRLFNALECLVFIYYTALLYPIGIHSYYSTPLNNSTLVTIYILYTLPGVCVIGYFVFLFLKKLKCTLCANMRAVAQYRDTEGILRRQSMQQEELPFRIDHPNTYEAVDMSQ